jgi:uncharacterized LabA/DUF88 family protein
MLSKAIKDQYNVAILVSGDADFAEVIQEVKELGKHVELATFPGQQCYYLKKCVDRFILLDEGFFEDCWI